VKFLTYSKYKPSGVQWLGDLPDHWSVNAVWHLFSLGRGRVISHEDIAENPGEYAVYSSQTENNGVLGFLGAYDFEGDYITWTTDGANAGTVFRRNGRFNCTNVCGTLKAKHPDKIESGFVAHALNLATREFIRYDINPKLMNNVMARIRIGVPPFPEQRVIADFLDAETGKLDSLIAKKRELIEKLKEKRAALISRTVTLGLPPEAARAAGLNPFPNLKPSGIEWLGEIPEHWEAKPLKRTVDFVEGPGILATDFADEGVPLIRIAGIGGMKVSLEGCNFLSPDLVTKKWSHFRVQLGDLLISCSASTGLCSEVDEATIGAIPYTGIIIVRPRLAVTEKNFIRWFFLSDQFLNQTELCKTGSTIQHFGPTHLSQMSIALPSVDEQCAIANFLDAETGKIDRMVEKVETVIEKLQEYRTSLITAAVTGKIDVRKIAA
jgi:type I restriction enzyme S subunit